MLTGCCQVQVVNDFGPLSNAELLRRYGFVECSENIHDCVEFSVEAVLQVSNQQKNVYTDLHCCSACAQFEDVNLIQHTLGSFVPKQLPEVPS